MYGKPDLTNDAQATLMRVCATCQQPAVRCVHVTAHYYKGIPSGRTYEYRCDGCGKTFQTLSGWRMVTQGLTAMVAGPIGLLMMGLGVADISRSWWMLLIGLLFAALGGWVGWTAVRSVLNETRNPRA